MKRGEPNLEHRRLGLFLTWNAPASWVVGRTANEEDRGGVCSGDGKPPPPTLPKVPSLSPAACIVRACPWHNFRIPPLGRSGGAAYPWPGDVVGRFMLSRARQVVLNVELQPGTLPFCDETSAGVRLFFATPCCRSSATMFTTFSFSGRCLLCLRLLAFITHAR